MRDHRSLEAWQEARELSRIAVRSSRLYWKGYAAALFGQLQRAAISIRLNVAEGYALNTRASFANQLRIAYGSAVETEELLELALEEDVLPESVCRPALAHCHRCERLLLGLLKRYRRPD
jgi:four helix bundle protein